MTPKPNDQTICVLSVIDEHINNNTSSFPGIIEYREKKMPSTGLDYNAIVTEYTTLSNLDFSSCDVTSISGLQLEVLDYSRMKKTAMVDAVLNNIPSVLNGTVLASSDITACRDAYASMAVGFKATSRRKDEYQRLRTLGLI